MRHEQPATGLWCTSGDEECWSPPGYFDTREEAEENGHAEWDGDFYVGQCRCLSARAVAHCCIPDDWGDVDQRVAEREDMTPEDRELVFTPTREQSEELEVLIAGWLDKHQLVGTYFNVDNAQKVAARDEAPS